MIILTIGSTFTISKYLLLSVVSPTLTIIYRNNKLYDTFKDNDPFQTCFQ